MRRVRGRRGHKSHRGLGRGGEGRRPCKDGQAGRSSFPPGFSAFAPFRGCCDRAGASRRQRATGLDRSRKRTCTIVHAASSPVTWELVSVPRVAFSFHTLLSVATNAGSTDCMCMCNRRKNYFFPRTSGLCALCLCAAWPGRGPCAVRVAVGRGHPPKRDEMIFRTSQDCVCT